MPSGTDITKFPFPSTLDPDLFEVSPFRTTLYIQPGEKRIALDTDDIIRQITDKGDPYVDIAHRLQDACRPDFSRPFSEEEIWLDAIDATRSCAVLHGNLPDMDIRTEAVTETAKRLIADGYPVRVEDDHFHLDPNEFDRLCSDIEADIRTIGGGTVLIQIFTWLRNSQQYQFERFIPGRTFLGHKPRLPSIPIGYLLNLGVKHLNNEPIRDDRVATRIGRRVAERARGLCALYDIEPYTTLKISCSRHAKCRPI